MNVLSRLFRAKPDPLLESAGRLVSAAHLHAVVCYTGFAERLPIILEIDMEQWNWVGTIAGVFIAATRLNHLGIDDSRKDRIHQVITDKMAAWKPDAIAGFEDCKAFFDRTYDDLAQLDAYKDDDRRFLAADSLGTWMVWNFVRHCPSTDAECQLIRVVGVSVTHSFFNWWQLP